MVVGLFDKIKSNGELKDLTSLKRFLEDEGVILKEDCNCSDPIAEMRRINTFDKSKMRRPPKKVYKVKELTVITKVDEKELIHIPIKGPWQFLLKTIQSLQDLKGMPSSPKDSKSVIGFYILMRMGYETDADGVHYWKVKNSAGTGWGENGFGKIIRQTSRNGKPSLIKYILCPVLLDNYEDEA
ncbi:hypothetical protein Rs2_22339 [Raphanus sativus]|nr:hypothetical protein Rs2_22339 [Raphanus sativus]